MSLEGNRSFQKIVIVYDSIELPSLGSLVELYSVFSLYN